MPGSFLLPLSGLARRLLRAARILEHSKPFGGPAARRFRSLVTGAFHRSSLHFIVRAYESFLTPTGSSLGLDVRDVERPWRR